jgi:proline iminopeptidase
MRMLTLLVAVGCATPIATTLHVDVRDAQLAMEVRGPARAAPILLYLHGGPGAALGLVAFRAYEGPLLEPHFVVAYLHERGVLGPPVADASQTIANHVGDVVAAAQQLRARFPHRPLILVGHSWGGMLALLAVAEHPALADGVVLIAAPIDFAGNQAASDAATLAWARASNTTDAVAQLETLGPPPYTRMEQQLVLSQWASAANGSLAAHLAPKRLLSRPPYTALDDSWQATEVRIATAMLPELVRVNLVPRLASIHVPMLAIAGALDTIVPPEQMKRDLASYAGPMTWLVLDHSQHLSFVDEPDRVAAAITAFADRIKPP